MRGIEFLAARRFCELFNVRQLQPILINGVLLQASKFKVLFDVSLGAEFLGTEIFAARRLYLGSKSLYLLDS